MLATILALLSLLQPPDASAAWRGRLDLSWDAYALGLRDLEAGEWLAGAGKRVWFLEHDGRERVHAALFVATDPSGGHVIGPHLGLNTGKLGEYASDFMKHVAPDVADKLPWLEKLANFVSVEAFAGWRPFAADGKRPFAWGYGGKVTIPLGSIGGGNPPAANNRPLGAGGL